VTGPSNVPAAGIAAALGMRALVFDVFGTVVDWHSSIVHELVRIGLPVDPPAFAEAWRAGYPPAMDEVRRGVLPWTNVDGLHRRILDRLLAERGLTLDEPAAAELNCVWHRLDPWPDSVPGLTRLKARWPIATLSNGNVSLLVDMARHARLPWDAVLSAELFGHYKPDPEAYLGAARLLDVAPRELMLVAAHPSDLRAAAASGLRTGYVARPDEHGKGGPMAPWTEGEFDVTATDFVALARQLEGTTAAAG
jgi:2-haloacid dehalogenase